MALRPCIGCRRLIASGSRCPACESKAHQAASPDRMRGRAWMRRRGAVLRRAGWVCEACGVRLAEEIHHRGELDDNRLASLLAVCRDCHRAVEAEKRG